MVFKSAADYSQSEKWNIAKGYTILLIQNALVQAAQLETIARFGVESINYSLALPMDQKNANRVEALERLCDKLQEIIASTAFSIEKRYKAQLESIEKQLDTALRIIPKLASEQMDFVTKNHKVVIDEKNFFIVHRSLRQIRRDLTFILDKNDLIFSSSDDWDEESLRRAWEEEG